MGTRAAMALVKGEFDGSDADLISSVCLSNVVPEDDIRQAQIGLVRYKGCCAICVCGQQAAYLISDAIDNEAAVLPPVLMSLFPEAPILVIHISTMVDLYSFAFYSGGELVRKWGIIYPEGIFADTGTKLPDEVRGDQMRESPEETIHSVTRTIMGFDIVELLNAVYQDKITPVTLFRFSEKFSE